MSANAEYEQSIRDAIDAAQSPLKEGDPLPKAYRPKAKRGGRKPGSKNKKAKGDIAARLADREEKLKKLTEAAIAVVGELQSAASFNQVSAMDSEARLMQKLRNVLMSASWCVARLNVTLI